MKKSIATAAVCGASLFGFTAVAGADPGAPTFHSSNPPNTGVACTTGAAAHNPNVVPLVPPNLGVSYLEGVAGTLCPPTQP